MTRRIYETPEDLAIERQVADILEQVWQVQLFKLPYAYHVDFVCFRDSKVTGFVEVKSRNISYATHDTAMISERKRMDAIRMANHFNVKALIVYRYLDGLFWLDFADEPDWREIGGRKNSDRDGQDIEIMAHWNKNKLKKIIKQG